MHRLPSEYLKLERIEKAFVVAAVQVKIDAEKEAEKERKRKQPRKGKKR